MSKDFATKIYGASDDLLEIEGGSITDEINEIDKPFLLTCSDGTTAVFKYSDDGEWKCEVKQHGSGFIELIKSVGEDGKHSGNAEGCSSYSDVLVIREPLAWVRVNRKYYRP